MLTLPGTSGGGSSLSPQGSGGVASSGSGNKQDDDTPQEPAMLTVPRYDFVLQFAWKEALLSDRLEQQEAEWAKEKPNSGAAPAGDGSIAANTTGGA